MLTWNEIMATAEILRREEKRKAPEVEDSNVYIETEFSPFDNHTLKITLSREEISGTLINKSDFIYLLDLKTGDVSKEQ